MTNALISAGVPLPTQRERLWRLVKDSPGRTAKSVALQSGEPHNSTSSILSGMVARGMLQEKLLPLRVKAGRGTAVRKVTHYWALGSTYELLPPPRKEGKKAATLALVPAPTAPSAQACAAAPAPAPPPDMTLDIEHLTIGEARSLYLKLKGMFA